MPDRRPLIPPALTEWVREKDLSTVDVIVFIGVPLYLLFCLVVLVTGI